MTEQKQTSETTVEKIDKVLGSLKNLLLFPAVASATILMIIVFKYSMLSYINAKLQYLGINGNLAYAIALPLFVLSAAVTAYIFSPKPEKRVAGIIMGTILWSIYFGYALYIQSDKNFDFTTGKIIMCYAETPTGYERLSCSWERHPKYGTAVLPINSEIINSEEIQKTGYQPVNATEPKCNWSYFTPDGQPLAWYYKHQDGKIDLFKRPGNHPQLNIKLIPITREVVEEICTNEKKAEQAESQRKALNAQATATPQVETPAPAKPAAAPAKPAVAPATAKPKPATASNSNSNRHAGNGRPIYGNVQTGEYQGVSNDNRGDLAPGPTNNNNNDLAPGPPESQLTSDRGDLAPGPR